MVLTRKRQAEGISPVEPQPVLEQELGGGGETPQPPSAKKRQIRDPLAVTRHQARYAAPSQHAQHYLVKKGLPARTTERKAALSARGKKLTEVRKAKKKAYEDSKRKRQGSTRPPGRVSGAMTRSAISEHYVRFEGSPPEEEWGGRGGVISRICDGMGLDKRSNWMRVRRVLEDTAAAKEAGRVYDPHARTRGRGRKRIIKYDSEQARVAP